MLVYPRRLVYKRPTYYLFGHRVIPVYSLSMVKPIFVFNIDLIQGLYYIIIRSMVFNSF